MKNKLRVIFQSIERRCAFFTRRFKFVLKGINFTYCNIKQSPSKSNNILIQISRHDVATILDDTLIAGMGVDI